MKMKPDAFFKRYGSRRLLKLAAVLSVADRRHEKKGEPGYSQHAAGHRCGTPACALGHWTDHAKGRVLLTRRVCDGGRVYGGDLVYTGFTTPSGEIHEARIAGTEFGLSFDEGNELFGGYGCGRAQTAKDAAAYIRRFVKNKLKSAGARRCEVKLSRFRRVMALIERFPEQHDQGSWHCGTTHCVAGWCDLVAAGYKRPELVKVGLTLSGGVKSLQCSMPRSKLLAFAKRARVDSSYTSERAAHWLGISREEGLSLFSSARTLDELREVARTGVIPGF